MSEDAILICLRVADHPIPGTDSVVETCSRCGEKVWQAISSPAIGRIICIRCLDEELKEAKKPLELALPTLTQIEDVIKHAPIEDTDQKEN